MYLLSILVLAVITAGGAIVVVEEPLINLQDTASDLIAARGGEQAGTVKDDAAMMANSGSNIVAEAECSPSLNQPRRRGKIRRGDVCSPDDRSRASPPKSQQGANEEKKIVPYQMAPDEESLSGSSAPSGNASDDPETICDPLVVGMNRQIAVCDTGRALNRILNINIRMPTVWPIATTYTGGSYTIEDVAFWTPPGCRRTSIMWCCIQTQPSRNDFLIANLPTPPWSMVGVDCVPAGGPGLSQEFLGPIQQFKR